MPAAASSDSTDGGPVGPSRRGRRRRGQELSLAWDDALPEADQPLTGEPESGEASTDELPSLSSGEDGDGDDEAFAAVDAPASWSGGWRERSKRSVAGAVFSGMAMALREIFEPDPSDESVLVVDANGEPVDLPVKVYLDPDVPAGSRCVVERKPVGSEP